MYGERELCTKIADIYPDIGECGISIDVTHDEKQEKWVVDLKKDSHELKHFLDYHDADDCIEGKQCVALGLEIAQLKKNIQGKQF